MPNALNLCNWKDQSAKGWGGVYSDFGLRALEECSTTAPSPSLTVAEGGSPSGSPSSWHDGTQVGCDFKLPEAESNDFEFKLTGLETLENTFSSLLFKLDTCASTPSFRDGDGSTIRKQASPQLSSLPLLPAPPGLIAPPGLDSVHFVGSTGAGDDVSRKSFTGMHTRSESSRSDQVRTPENCTTVMLRNIPNKYTQEMLIAQTRCYRYDLDFMYLPIDFKNKCNVGYAFLNFRTSGACSRFAWEFHGASAAEKLPGFCSQKVCEVTSARVQGLEENVRRLQNSVVMAQLIQHPEWLPTLFDTNGNVIPFPVPPHPVQPTVGRRRGGQAHRRMSGLAAPSVQGQVKAPGESKVLAPQLKVPKFVMNSWPMPGKVVV